MKDKRTVFEFYEQGLCPSCRVSKYGVTTKLIDNWCPICIATWFLKGEDIWYKSLNIKVNLYPKPKKKNIIKQLTK